jgi:hypothetical protein
MPVMIEESVLTLPQSQEYWAKSFLRKLDKIPLLNYLAQTQHPLAQQIQALYDEMSEKKAADAIHALLTSDKNPYRDTD